MMYEKFSFSPLLHQRYNMFMKSKTFPIITIACVMSLLVSCAVPGFRMEYVNEAEEFLSMNEEPHLYDTVPVVLPHIVTDKAGFESEAEKVAVFTSASIPQTFEIIDADTGRRAFSGVVKTKRNPGNGSAPLGYGYFTELTIPGNYYIKCAGLGESYPFVITDDLIRDIVPDALDDLVIVREKRMTVKARDTKGAEVEMDGGLGWDVVKPTTAKVLATFRKGGDAAVLVNEFGKGRCYFITANYFAHAHMTSRWEMMPGRFDFWQNVVELMGSMAKAGYAKAGATLPVEITGVTREVEVTVDDQGSRYVVQMLDYDVKSEGVKGAKLNVPGERKRRRVYYPGGKAPLKLDGRTATLRGFSVYDMFVVEFDD